MRNVEKHNFTYNGCNIKFYERPTDYGIDVIVSKGNLRRCYKLSELLEEYQYITNCGTFITRIVDYTEKRIEQFKCLVIKGELELI